jgi:hypothetical protein
LNTDKNLGKEWFSRIYVNDQGEVDFTDPFTMENRPTTTNNNNIIGAVGSFNLDDSQGYYVIPKTNNIFVEVLDNKEKLIQTFL